MRRKPSWDFSVPGLMFATAMMFMGVAAMNTQANLLFGVFGLLVGVLLISLVISRLVLAGLTVRRALPDAAVVGQKTVIGYEFSNVKRYWPTLSVQVAELDGVEAFRKQPHAYLLHAPARGVVPVRTEVVPKRRGVHRLGRYQIATSFPFGFVKRAVVRHQDDSLVVFPALARMDARVMRLLRSAETAGVTVRPRRGGEDEVFGIREYRPGENPRLIHWRRSARTMATTGQLVAREMTRVSPPRVLLVVDTRLRDGSAGAYAEVERTIAVAASLASEALEQGLMVGVAAVSGDTAEQGGVEAGKLAVSAVMPNRGKRHRRDVLSALARLGKNTTVEGRRVLEQVTSGLPAGTTPVLVTAGGLEQNLAEHSRGAVVVLAVNSPQVRAWFDFGAEVDFATCMPPDQQPAEAGKGPGSAGGGMGEGYGGESSGGKDERRVPKAGKSRERADAV